MKKSEFKKNKRYLIFPSILILIAICMPYLYVDSAQNSYDSNVQTFDSTLNSVKGLKTTYDKAQEQSDRFKRYNKIIDEFEKIIPLKNQLPDIIDNISLLANEAGISINDVRYMKSDKDIEKDIFLPSVRLDMHISGEYQAIVDFLSKIEQVNYLAYNEEIQLSENSFGYSVKIRVLTK